MAANSQESGESASDPPSVARNPLVMHSDDTGLLIVDMQPKLLAAIPYARRIVWNCRRLLDAARIEGIAIDATEQNPEKLGGTHPELAIRLFTPARAKLAFSAAACGELPPGWTERGICRVLLAGIETHVCVAQTALDLLAAGVSVYVAVDAVGARGQLDHDVSLRRLEASGATLTTTEAVLFEWHREAGTPEFRQISALVKEPPPEA